VQTEQRFKELTDLGLKVQVVAVGRKASQYMERRPKFNVVSK
jgi:F0F1-type ATP synthase gamma subunit